MTRWPQARASDADSNTWAVRTEWGICKRLVADWMGERKGQALSPGDRKPFHRERVGVECEEAGLRRKGSQ